MGCDSCRTAAESPRGFAAARSDWGRAGPVAARWESPFIESTNSGGRQCRFRALKKPTSRQRGGSDRSLRLAGEWTLPRGLNSKELPQAPFCRVLRV